MEQLVLNEELGISNDVKELVSMFKNRISDDYGKNRCVDSYYGEHKGFHDVFNNTVILEWRDIGITIKYYVLETTSDELRDLYLEKLVSKADTRIYSITYYLTSNPKNNKINWGIHNEVLQHEVEHMYQLYRKKKRLLCYEKQIKYDEYKKFTESNDYIERIIGYTYYYYTKIERNAIINGLYNKIMDDSKDVRCYNPWEAIQSSIHFKNIKEIKKIIEDGKALLEIEKRLKAFDKKIFSFIKIAKIVVNEYTKAFGKLLYKLKKDIAERDSQWLWDPTPKLLSLPDDI